MALSIEDIAVFCKKKGFVYPSSEIYGGLAGFWDFGPLGVELFNNIKADWWKYFVQSREDMVGIDASIISHPRIWKASGHIESFSDVAIQCKTCKRINKVDKADVGKARCEFCGGELDIKTAKELKLLFPLSVGSNGITAYLRGETAQGMFTDFKIIADTSRKRAPFGIAQIGKCFRNEIAPRDFLFRSREFTIGEFEFFIHPDEKKCSILDKKHLDIEVMLLDAETQEQGETGLKKTKIGKMVKDERLGEWHAYWLAEQALWLKSLGMDMDKIKVREHVKTELSHYSSATFDIDYNYPFGSKEVAGIANRGQYDLNQHIKESKERLELFDEETKKKIIPRVIEPTFGMERIFLAVLADAYNYDKKRGNIILKLHPKLAPVKVGVFSLVNKLNKEARKVYDMLKTEFVCQFDASGSIGRRYARADEIGIPYCVTFDFDSLKDKAVTIRDRNDIRQIRVKISELVDVLKKLLDSEIKLEKAGKLVR
jgi:glycyl-tRNA synthetase